MSSIKRETPNYLGTLELQFWNKKVPTTSNIYYYIKTQIKNEFRKIFFLGISRKSTILINRTTQVLDH